MITKEKLQRILNFPFSQEERIIKYVYEKSGCILVNESSICKDLQMDKATLLLHVRQSNYLEYDKITDLLKVNRKGKENTHVYDNPLEAESINDFVYSYLVKDFSLTYKRSIPLVYDFCTKKQKSITGYLNNPNIFQTIKKHVKKYLVSINQLP